MLLSMTPLEAMSAVLEGLWRLDSVTSKRPGAIIDRMGEEARGALRGLTSTDLAKLRFDPLWVGAESSRAKEASASFWRAVQGQ